MGHIAYPKQLLKQENLVYSTSQTNASDESSREYYSH